VERCSAPLHALPFDMYLNLPLCRFAPAHHFPSRCTTAIFLVLRRRDGLLLLGTVPALVESTPVPSFLLTAVRDGVRSCTGQQRTLFRFTITTIALVLLVPLPFGPLRRIVALASFLFG